MACDAETERLILSPIDAPPRVYVLDEAGLRLLADDVVDFVEDEADELAGARPRSLRLINTRAEDADLLEGLDSLKSLTIYGTIHPDVLAWIRTHPLRELQLDFSPEATDELLDELKDKPGLESLVVRERGSSRDLLAEPPKPDDDTPFLDIPIKCSVADPARDTAWAILVAGWAVYTTVGTARSLVQGLSRQRTLAAVPLGDTSAETGPYESDDHDLIHPILIGLEIAIAEADEPPQPLPDAVTISKALKKARASLTRVFDLADEHGFELDTHDAGLLLGAFGALPAARLARGRLVKGKLSVPEGMVEVRGHKSNQEGHEQAVHGRLVAWAEYESSGFAEVDLSQKNEDDTAHSYLLAAYD